MNLKIYYLSGDNPGSRSYTSSLTLLSLARGERCLNQVVHTRFVSHFCGLGLVFHSLFCVSLFISLSDFIDFLDLGFIVLSL